MHQNGNWNVVSNQFKEAFHDLSSSEKLKREEGFTSVAMLGLCSRKLMVQGVWITLASIAEAKSRQKT